MGHYASEMRFMDDGPALMDWRSLRFGIRVDWVSTPRIKDCYFEYPPRFRRLLLLAREGMGL